MGNSQLSPLSLKVHPSGIMLLLMPLSRAQCSSVAYGSLDYDAAERIQKMDFGFVSFHLF